MASTSQMPSDLMEALMRDPVKRALILQLLHKEKDNIEKYKQEQLKTKTTPLKKNNKLHCESPTALQRRRALEQKDSASEGSSSDVSDVPTEVKGPKLPFDTLLKGVRAYVEVKRNNEDRSEGIKAVMRLMGATIRDKFTNDVTHVVFKDGSFTTYEKAKLMKIHLVSVLWLDAVRRNNARVPEKNYPAFGNRVCDANVSVLCSQIQKDYEDVIKDERRRRHTLGTPRTSIASYMSAQNLPLSEDDRNKAESPEVTSDDSDCPIIDGEASRRRKNTDVLSQTNLTDETNNSDSASLLSRVTMRNKRRTIHTMVDMVLTPNQARGRDDGDKENEENDKDGADKRILKDSTLQSSTMSSLRMSTESDRTKSGLGSTKGSLGSNKRKSGSSAGKENNSIATVNTSMSSLRLSTGDSEAAKEKKSSGGKSKTQKKIASEEKIEEDHVEVASKTKRTSPATSSSASQGQVKASKGRKKDSSPEERKGGRKSRVSKELFKQSAREEETSESSEDSSASSSEDDSKKSVPPPKEKGRKSLTSSKSSSSKSGDTDNVKKSKQKGRQSVVYSRRTSSDEDDGESKNAKDFLEPTPKQKTKKPSNVAERVKMTTKSATKGKEKNNIGSSPHIEASPVPFSKKVQRRTLLDTSESDFEDLVNSSIGNKKGRNAADEDQLPVPTPRRSRRISTALSTPARSRRPSTDFATPATRKRESSVASSRSSRRSVSVEKPPKTVEGTPSPAKKSRLEKKTRKLYNPEHKVSLEPSKDDKEREEYVKQKTRKSPNDVFVDPNTVPLLVKAIGKGKTKPPSVALTFSDSSSSEDNTPTPQKVKKVTKKVKTPPRRDSSLDEQKELLALLQKSEDNRKSERLSMSQRKPKYTYSSSSETMSTTSLPITPIKRRSTLDFQSLTQSQRKRKLMLDPKRPFSIVCTKMHRQEVVNFENVVATLGNFFVEDKVTGKTTHLVCGESKRTVNMLRAIARGCWILKHDWLLKSAEAGRWLNEEDYEVTDFSPAVQQCRLQREAFGPLYSMDIFEDCGFIYVGKGTSPRAPDLKELILICKGKVTTAYRNATISVGELVQREGVTCVTEMWVLDSIHFNKLKNFKNYLMRKGNDSPNF